MQSIIDTLHFADTSHEHKMYIPRVSKNRTPTIFRHKFAKTMPVVDIFGTEAQDAITY